MTSYAACRRCGAASSVQVSTVAFADDKVGISAVCMWWSFQLASVRGTMDLEGLQACITTVELAVHVAFRYTAFRIRSCGEHSATARHP